MGITFFFVQSIIFVKVMIKSIVKNNKKNIQTKATLYIPLGTTNFIGNYV